MKTSLSNGWLLRELGFAYWVAIFQMQEVAGERGGYLHGRGALDSDDLLYLKEQMEAEEDAERLLRRTEKRAFAAFKKAASLADSSPAAVPLSLRVEPKAKSGIRQQDLLKRVVEVKPKRQKASGEQASTTTNLKSEATLVEKDHLPPRSSQSKGEEEDTNKMENPVRSLLAAYDSSDNDED